MPKAADVVATARPIVRELAKDEKLRKHLIEALTAARSAYSVGADRTTKAVASRIASDRHVQKELKKTVDEVRRAARKARKRSHAKRNVLLLGGLAVGLLYNPVTGPNTRRWLRERLGRHEEHFEYEPQEPEAPIDE